MAFESALENAFAIVRTADPEVDSTRVARAIAEPLGIAVADLVQTLGQQPGILAEELDEALARRCVALLAQAGVEARAVPQASIVELPEVVTLRSGRPDDSVFFYVGSRRKGVVKWPDVLWVDLVSVQELSTEKFDDVEIGAGGEGTTIERFKNHRLVTKYRMFIDMVSQEPWFLLRIPQEPFEFAATGLPNFSSRRENLIALAAVIASRASRACLGTGLKWIDSDAPRREHRVASQAKYDGCLRWELTRLFLQRA
jgi:hypothetical protein